MSVLLLNLPNGMNRSTRHGESLLIRIFISLVFGVCVFSLKITVGSVHHHHALFRRLSLFRIRRRMNNQCEQQALGEKLRHGFSWISNDTDARAAGTLFHFIQMHRTNQSSPAIQSLRPFQFTLASDESQFNTKYEIYLFSSLTLQQSKLCMCFTFGSGYDRIETFTMFFPLSLCFALFLCYSIFNSLRSFIFLV